MTVDAPQADGDTASETTGSVWQDEFDEATRKELSEDDSAAWRSVTGLLLAIVVMGVSIAVFAVVICSFTSF